jgi:hypothetical protein
MLWWYTVEEGTEDWARVFNDSGYCQWNPWNNLAWKVNRSAAFQEIPFILWNLTFHYRIHNSLPPVHVLSQFKPVHTLPQNFLNVYVLFPPLPRSSKWFLSLILPYQTIYTPLFPPCFPHAPPIPFFFIRLRDVYLVWSTEYLVKIQARVIHKFMWFKKRATYLAKLGLRYI